MILGLNEFIGFVTKMLIKWLCVSEFVYFADRRSSSIRYSMSVISRSENDALLLLLQNNNGSCNGRGKLRLGCIT